MWRLTLNCYIAACDSQAIGLASGGRIPDDSFSASSIFRARYAAKYGRLNGRGAWEPKTTTDPDDYLQIDLLYEYVICAVATQGSPPSQSSAQEWTTEYKLGFSLNGTTFFPYKENKTDKVGMSCSHIQVFITAKINTCGTKLKLLTRTTNLLIHVIDHYQLTNANITHNILMLLTNHIDITFKNK